MGEPARNQLEGPIPDEPGQCGALEKLELFQNQLTGPIPDELGQCGALEVLHFAQNQLTGGVPASLSKCAKLRQLDLQQNKLTGGVPASLGKCVKLTRLTLDANQLEGAVPATELAALTALTDLYLDENEGLTITARQRGSGPQEGPPQCQALPADGGRRLTLRLLGSRKQKTLYKSKS